MTERWKRFWSNRSGDSSLKEMCYGLTTDEEYLSRCKFVGEKLGLNKETVFLDAGCGNGLMLSTLVSNGFLREEHCVGIDYSHCFIEKARARLPKATFIELDLSCNKMPFSNDFFDASVCYSVTHYLSENEVKRVIEELRRVTRNKVLVGDVATIKEFLRVHGLLGKLFLPFRRLMKLGSVTYLDKKFFSGINAVFFSNKNDERFDAILLENKEGLK